MYVSLILVITVLLLILLVAAPFIFYPIHQWKIRRKSRESLETYEKAVNEQRNAPAAKASGAEKRD